MSSVLGNIFEPSAATRGGRKAASAAIKSAETPIRITQLFCNMIDTLCSFCAALRTRIGRTPAAAYRIATCRPGLPGFRFTPSLGPNYDLSPRDPPSAGAGESDYAFGRISNG